MSALLTFASRRRQYHKSTIRQAQFSSPRVSEIKSDGGGARRRMTGQGKNFVFGGDLKE